LHEPYFDNLYVFPTSNRKRFGPSLHFEVSEILAVKISPEENAWLSKVVACKLAGPNHFINTRIQQNG
jgi:hypothetical protein